jgi:hypothetical protein
MESGFGLVAFLQAPGGCYNGSMDTDFTHAYCENCRLIRPVIREGLAGSSDKTGQFVGGDVLCGECRSVIATVYKKIQDNTLPLGTIKQTPDE